MLFLFLLSACFYHYIYVLIIILTNCVPTEFKLYSIPKYQCFHNQWNSDNVTLSLCYWTQETAVKISLYEVVPNSGDGIFRLHEVLRHATLTTFTARVGLLKHGSAQLLMSLSMPIHLVTTLRFNLADLGCIHQKETNSITNSIT